MTTSQQPPRPTSHTRTQLISEISPSRPDDAWSLSCAALARPLLCAAMAPCHSHTSACSCSSASPASGLAAGAVMVPEPAAADSGSWAPPGPTCTGCCSGPSAGGGAMVPGSIAGLGACTCAASGDSGPSCHGRPGVTGAAAMMAAVVVAAACCLSGGRHCGATRTPPPPLGPAVGPPLPAGACIGGEPAAPRTAAAAGLPSPGRSAAAVVAAPTACCGCLLPWWHPGWGRP